MPAVRSATKRVESDRQPASSGVSPYDGQPLSRFWIARRISYARLGQLRVAVRRSSRHNRHWADGVGLQLRRLFESSSRPSRLVHAGSTRALDASLDLGLWCNHQSIAASQRQTATVHGPGTGSFSRRIRARRIVLSGVCPTWFQGKCACPPLLASTAATKSLRRRAVPCGNGLLDSSPIL